MPAGPRSSLGPCPAQDESCHLPKLTQHCCPSHHSFSELFFCPKTWLFRIFFALRKKKIQIDLPKVLTGSVSHSNGQKSLQKSPPRTHQGPRKPGAWAGDVPVTCCRTSHHNIPGIRYHSGLCHKGRRRTFADLKPDVGCHPCHDFLSSVRGVAHYPEKLQFGGSKFLGASRPVEQGKQTEGCEAQGYSQPGTPEEEDAAQETKLSRCPQPGEGRRSPSSGAGKAGCCLDHSCSLPLQPPSLC